MSSMNRRSSFQNEAFLKSRVKELEQEVSSLKRRLDELRKAKNTTLIKRERETIEVNAPNLGSRRESKANDVDDLQNQLEENKKRYQKQLDDLKQVHKSEIAELIKKHKEEIQEKTSVKPKADCGHEKEITDLKNAIGDLQGDNAAILVENDDLKERINILLHDLSVKEAKICETEKEIEQKLNIKWQKMYQDWMAATESKLEELQQANALLRRMIDTGKARGRDPTGQDKT